jgi:hypothetical protein
MNDEAVFHKRTLNTTFKLIVQTDEKITSVYLQNEGLHFDLQNILMGFWLSRFNQRIQHWI